MKKNIGVLMLVLSSLLLTGCQQSQSLITARIGDSKKLKLEVVSTPSDIARGLSGRDRIGADGMLFVFPSSTRPRFWMKEMKFDLDLIWIREKKIVEITPRVPAPDPQTPLNQLPTYVPSQPVDMVLEVEALKAREWGWSVGDEILI